MKQLTSIVQQGSVSGGVLCSASTAEVTKEDLGRGCQIGLANIKAVTFVDDITTINTELEDTYLTYLKFRAPPIFAHPNFRAINFRAAYEFRSH